MTIKILVMENKQINCKGTYRDIITAIQHMSRDLYDDYSKSVRQAGLFTSQNDLLYPFPENLWKDAKSKNLSAPEFADLVTGDADKIKQLEKFAVSLGIK